MYISNKIFDSLWKKSAAIPLLDLSIVYKPPKQYDDYKRLNLQFIDKKYFAIEGNKKFRISGKQKEFDYYDTTNIQYPEQQFDLTNKIYLEFENSPDPDSIFLVISKSKNSGIYWNQIFYSSVTIELLNRFSTDPEKFRIDENSLVNRSLLNNNDTLINEAINYYEKHKLLNADCGKNSSKFKEVCDMYNLPCRTIGLQGGNANEVGYDNILGYPLHAICEIYSSKYKKWYVLDPTYGLRFRDYNSDNYMNAVEIKNMYYFNREKLIIQDSILTTMRSTVGRDYFKYYENIYYFSELNIGQPWQRLMAAFFKKFQYYYFHCSNNLIPIKNGYYYIIVKSMVYLLITVLYFNAILLIITRRLFSIKKPKNVNK